MVGHKPTLSSRGLFPSRFLAGGVGGLAFRTGSILGLSSGFEPIIGMICGSGTRLNPVDCPRISGRNEHWTIFHPEPRLVLFRKSPKTNPESGSGQGPSTAISRSGETWEYHKTIHDRLDAQSFMNAQMQDYFSRQSAVREFGHEGLKRLQKATVAVVGTGGVGSAAAWFLASLGIGQLTLIDQDLVEVSNLHRLSGIDPHELNAPKAEAVARAIRSRYPWTMAMPVVETIRQENGDELLRGSDIIVDGTDNFWTRKVLNRLSIRHGIPYLFTSAIANQGHLSLFNPPTTPCLECAFPRQELNSSESCETLGVTSSIVGLVGGLAATEGAKKILGLPTNIRGRLLTIDLLGPEFIITSITKREDCEACGSESSVESSEGRIVMMCGERTANIIPEKNFSIDLRSLSGRIPRDRLITSSDSVVVYNGSGHRVSVFKTGRLLIDGVSNENNAIQVASDVWAEILR